jgi:flagellar L-ring protein FlgH
MKMTKTTASKIGIVAALAVLAVALPQAQGGSIWAKGQARARQLYADDTARKVGDSLTILIEEESKIENQAERKMDKTTARTNKSGGTFDFGNIISGLKNKNYKLPSTDISAAATSNFDGKTQFDNERKVTDKITVTVEDVLPNGNLVVLGKRERLVDGDKQTVQTSGVVRPSDVAFDNSVSSKQVADFKMVYLSHGQESNFTNPGWWARLINWLNPE